MYAYAQLTILLYSAIMENGKPPKPELKVLTY